MLQLAAPADPEHRTAWLDPGIGGGQDSLETSAGVPGMPLDDPRANPLSGRGPRNEHDQAVRAAHAVAPVGNPLDLELDRVARGETRRLLAHDSPVQRAAARQRAPPPSPARSRGAAPGGRSASSQAASAAASGSDSR